jgi:ribosomal protein L44E
MNKPVLKTRSTAIENRDAILVALYQCGEWNIREIAEALGFSYSLVWRVIDRDCPRWTQEQLDAAKVDAHKQYISLKRKKLRQKGKMMNDPRFLQNGFEKRLAYAIEECGEFLAAAGKTQRWGPKSVNPLLHPTVQETNIDWLKRELDDVRQALNRLEATFRELD